MGSGESGFGEGRLFAADADIEAEALHFLDEHIEGLRSAGFERVVALDDALVNAGAAGDIVGLDREEFLERVGGSVGLERPDFHFSETLATVLGLAAERLLGDEAVRSDSAGVDFVRPSGRA